MHYNALHNILLNLEAKIPSAPASGFPYAGNVRTVLSSVQGFALDTITQGRDLPIIVTLGVNYSQGTQQGPRDYARGVGVEDPFLSPCRSNLVAAMAHRASANPTWVAKGRANALLKSFSAILDFHLVMTNFCLWNTNSRWLKTTAAGRHSLLANNPLYAGAPSCAPNWLHLVDLASALSPEPILWVAHGLHSEVFRLFAAPGFPISMADWMMTPNLAYRYFHYGRCYPR